MLRTIITIAICIILAIFIAAALSIFLIPQQKLRYQDCVLLQNSKTGQIDCFGCVNNICKDATLEWSLYQAPQVGVPYACFKTEKGCQLAQ
jgi:hypothetical protein